MQIPEDNKIIPEEVLRKKRVEKITASLIDDRRFNDLLELDSETLTEVAKELLLQGKFSFFLMHHDIFEGIDNNEIINLLFTEEIMTMRNIVSVENFMHVLGVLKGVDSSKFLDKFVEKDMWNMIVHGLSLNFFKFKLENWIAERLLEEGYFRTVASFLDRFEDIDELLNSDINFVSILEGVWDGPSEVRMYTNYNGKQLQSSQQPDIILNRIEYLLNVDVVKNDPIKILYITRMLLLFPVKYSAIMEFIKDIGGLPAQIFETYKPYVAELGQTLEAMRESENSIDAKKPSYNLEIEIMNIDRAMELDTPITNDTALLINFVKKLDEVQKKIRDEIQQYLKNSKNDDRQIIGIYDSVHINIGIPRSENDLLQKYWAEETKSFKGIYFLLELIGLVYNSIGRVVYMYEKVRGLIVVDINDTIDFFGNSPQVKLGYNAKLQDRLWSFNLTTDNVPMLEVLMRYMDRLCKHYIFDMQSVRERVNLIINDIIEFIKQKEQETYARLGEEPEEELPLTYGELIEKDSIGSWTTAREKIKKGVFPHAYLLDRNEILRFIMQRLADEIKKPLV